MEDDSRIIPILLDIRQDIGSLLAGQRVANGRLAEHDAIIASLVARADAHEAAFKRIEEDAQHALEIRYARRWPMRLLRGLITSAPVAGVTGLLVKLFT